MRAARAVPLVSAAFGLVACAGWAWRAGWAALETLLLFAALALVPLALAALARADRRGRDPALHRAAAFAQPVAALLLLASFAQPPGRVAALLALPWLALTLVLALWGAQRFVQRGARPVEELAIDGGLVFVAVGGAWLVASRAGVAFLGFREPVVILTAIHFHVAAFAAPVLAGLVGRALARRAPRALAFAVACLLAGPPLLAVGIAASPLVEKAAALVMAAGVLVTAGLLLRLPRRRALGVAAALAPLVSMPLAVAYAWARGLDVATMARVHGALNAYLFAFAGLGAMLLLDPEPRVRGGAPFSRLRSRGATGPLFFERVGAVDDTRAPQGLVDDLDAYRVGRVDPRVRAFYERTARHGLVVVPAWLPLARPLGRLYAAYARRAGQMRFPEAPEGELVESRILAVREDADGRPATRAWVRTYARSGDPVYVAAYATHVEAGETFMNIAFPFPGWNLTSILRMEPLGRGGVALTTLPPPRGGGDQGVFAATRAGAFRLPINETIRVWAADDPAAPFAPRSSDVTALARHEIWALGVRFLALDYHIFEAS